jgi:hypothetical protein
MLPPFRTLSARRFYPCMKVLQAFVQILHPYLKGLFFVLAGRAILPFGIHTFGFEPVAFCLELLVLGAEPLAFFAQFAALGTILLQLPILRRRGLLLAGRRGGGLGKCGSIQKQKQHKKRETAKN